MQQFDDTEDRPRNSGRALRWLARFMFVILGLMMGVVVASDPRVTDAARAVLAGMQGEDEVVSRHDTTLAFPALPAIAERVWEGVAPDGKTNTDAPRVSTMPESSVNVIRLTP